MADRSMTLILRLIEVAGKTSTVLEDAFLVVGSLASGQHRSIFDHVALAKVLRARSP
jgi:hypothetical protein